MRTGVRIALLVVLVAAGAWLWRIVFPGDEALIRKQLQELAEVASFAPDEAPLVKVANAASVGGYFTIDTSIEINVWDRGRFTISGRDEVRQYAVAARNAVASLTIGVDGVRFTAGPADDRATVRLTLIGRSSQNPERQTQEMEMEMARVDGEWLIHRARTFEYLSQ